MKRIISYTILSLFCVGIYAQRIPQNDIPAIVLNTFHLNAPNATDVSWILEDGNYIVSYKENNKRNILTLDYKGGKLTHSKDLYLSEIPYAVLKTIGEKVPYYDVHDADMVDEEGKIIYEIYFKIEDEKYLFWIEDNGKLIKFRKELNNDQIPPLIIEAIKTKYSSFELDRGKFLEEGKLKYYIIRGEINNYDCVINIDEKGNFLRHKQDLNKSEIPNSVKNTLNKSYKGFEIRSVYRFEEKAKVTYNIKLRKSKENRFVTISPTGEILETK